MNHYELTILGLTALSSLLALLRSHALHRRLWLVESELNGMRSGVRHQVRTIGGGHVPTSPKNAA
jgi:hypothetical protein